MKRRDFRQLAVLAALALPLGTGCVRTRVPEPQRASFPDLRGGDPGSIGRIPPVQTPLEQAQATACETLESLRIERARVAGPGFSVFASLSRKSCREQRDCAGLEGAIDPASSPFTRLFLGESFRLDTPEEFYEKARTEYLEGRLSGVLWTLLKTARAFPSVFRSIQLSVTHDKLEDAFPGIFGKDSPADDSLLVKLARKSGSDLSSEEELRILTAELPLFGSATSWDRARADAESALAAAVASTGGSAKERLCGFVLWQRAAGQLFALKGYRSPELRSAGENRTRVRKIDGNGFASVEVPGVFLDREAKKGVVLTSELISGYDPAKKAFGVTKLPLAGAYEDGGVDSLLSFLEGAIQLYDATSPAAPWFQSGQGYLLGDITAEGNPAILPHEAHGLALGLVVMGFKNLASRHILLVNSAGALKAPGESAAGMLVADDSEEGLQPGGSGEIVIPVSRVLSLVRSVVYLDTALKRFGSRKASEWSALSPVYTESVLAQLLGADLFSEEELARILPAEERGNVLRARLSQLPLPLALLMTKFSDETGSCRRNLYWNLRTGEAQAAGLCDEKTRDAYRSALELLGRHSESPALLRRAGWRFGR